MFNFIFYKKLEVFTDSIMAKQQTLLKTTTAADLLFCIPCENGHEMTYKRYQSKIH